MFRNTELNLACFDDYASYLHLKENDAIAFESTYTELNPLEKRQYETLLPALQQDLISFIEMVRTNNQTIIEQLNRVGAAALYIKIKNASQDLSYDGFLKTMKDVSLKLMLLPSGSYPDNFMKHIREWCHANLFTAPMSNHSCTDLKI